MTCIVGLVDNGEVWMGGDSAQTQSSDLMLQVIATEKVFRRGEYLFGAAGSARMAQALRYAFDPPAPPIDGDMTAFMATAFVDALRACLKDSGAATNEAGAEYGSNFLVGIRGRLYEITRSYQVAEYADGFAAIGCGDQIAHGAMYATKDWPAESRILTALAAAERFSAGVRAPFVVLSAK